jgi:cobalt-zinc-cadmium efflux system membrane fusion protein
LDHVPVGDSDDMPCCAALTPDGGSFLVGTADGVILRLVLTPERRLCTARHVRLEKTEAPGRPAALFSWGGTTSPRKDMAGEQLRTFLRRLRHVVSPEEAATDAQLLERFVRRRDDAAFEVLVWRHGGLVLAVCGRLLGQAEDAEDVFQATFLALARRAGTIGKRESLGSWLYKVAYRVALRVRSRAAREAARRRPLPDLTAPPPAGTEAWRDLLPALDEEINRLPERYRAAVVLCYLEGKTTDEAARQLGCARGTVCSRLSWARQRLCGRLARRGLAPPVGLAAALAPRAARAALVDAAARAAVAFASGPAAGALAGRAANLAEGVVRAMQLGKWKTVAVVFLLGALTLGAGLCVRPALAQRPKDDEAPAFVRGTGDGVRMPAEAPAKMGLRVSEVRPRAAANARRLRLVGWLAIDPERLFRVRCRFTPAEVVEVGQTSEQGQARELQSGDTVRKGQLLAVLESADVAAKTSDLFDALVQLKLDEDVLAATQRAYDKGTIPLLDLLNARRAVEARRGVVNRAENTLTAWGIPEKQIEAVRKEAAEDKRKDEAAESRKARRKRWARVGIVAPEGGTIVERNVSRDEVIVDGTAILFQIARVDRLLVVARVNEADLPALEALKPEQRRWDVRPIADAGAAPASGRIDEVGYLIDPKEHATVAKGHVDNAGGRLRPGQAVTATVTLSPPAGEVVLPAAAIVEEGGQTFVFVQPDAKKPLYEQRRVSVVRRGGDVIHIRSRLTSEQERQGLQTVRPGERVVTAGAVELKAVLDDLKAAADR